MLMSETPKTKHFVFKTDDVFWAVTMAGTLKNLKSDRKDLSWEFQTSNPLLDSLRSECWRPALPNAEEVVVHLPFHQEEVEELQSLYERKIREELKVFHGLKLNEGEAPTKELPIPKLCEAYLQIRHRIIAQAGFFYPFGQAVSSDPCIVYSDPKYKDIAEAILRGWQSSLKLHQNELASDDVAKKGRGLAQKQKESKPQAPIKTLLIEDESEFIGRMSSPSTKLIIVPLKHPAFVIARAYYQGYEHASKAVGCVGILPSQAGQLTIDEVQHLLTWGVSYLSIPDCPISEWERFGQVWGLKAYYGFDHIKYQKALPEERVKSAGITVSDVPT